MSAFIVNTNVMSKAVTAILLNLDMFDGESTSRTALLASPTDAQKEAGTKIGRKLFLMNRRALRARYGYGDHLRLPEFVFERWADATPVEQFKAIHCLLYQCHEGTVHESRLYDELNHAAGELAQRIVQDLPNTTRLPGATEPRRASSAAVEGASGVRSNPAPDRRTPNGTIPSSRLYRSRRGARPRRHGQRAQGK
jgi:hypothetical protein